MVEWLIQKAWPKQFKMAFARTDTRFFFIFFSRFKLVITRWMINVREHRSFLKKFEQPLIFGEWYLLFLIRYVIEPHIVYT